MKPESSSSHLSSPEVTIVTSIVYILIELDIQYIVLNIYIYISSSTLHILFRPLFWLFNICFIDLSMAVVPSIDVP